ncbi:hypothetical protein TBR22_A01910 [Luteitalea sp. TBR-22]|uniref:hypothetical protein n=1 Tax=Luteitalea sp. TBR-22 TaxID=2802971 RepID=UPI001AF58C72|nr:hypothetical protein [Luteitalea sp. TBR-22]BCS30992.1 hypothetical protein TBR22_A01910 [Luteitalea sp. TBR-22]
MARNTAALAAGVATVAVLALGGCHAGPSRDTSADDAPWGGTQVVLPARASGEPELVQVPPPPFSDGVFPCSDCHAQPDLPPNRTRRVLVDAHDEIVLKHDEEHRWCLDCHDAVDRDQLHLAGGELVPFSESYRLCGQCHGEKHRDWRAGIHGRRTGFWNGRKEYLLCVHCHDPHAPRFKPLVPRPAPVHPGPMTR